MPPSNHYQSFINKNSFEGFGLISFPRFSAVNSQIEQIDGKSVQFNRKGSANISNNIDNNQANTANMSVISSGNEDDFKMEYLQKVKPREWKNIPIPIVECVETIINEFFSQNHKLNSQFDAIKRFERKMRFDYTKAIEIIRLKQQ